MSFPITNDKNKIAEIAETAKITASSAPSAVIYTGIAPVRLHATNKKSLVSFVCFVGSFRRSLLLSPVATPRNDEKQATEDPDSHREKIGGNP